MGYVAEIVGLVGLVGLGVVALVLAVNVGIGLQVWGAALWRWGDELWQDWRFTKRRGK